MTSHSKPYRPLPPVEAILALFTIDPDEGIFRWQSGKRAGAEAGQTDPYGYRQVNVPGYGTFQAHRLAWKVYHGENPALQIDHINRDRKDNRKSNLRQATNTQNAFGMIRRRKLHDLPKGVYKSGRRFGAQIKINYKHINLGTFATVEEAQAAYMNAARAVAGDYARAG